MDLLTLFDAERRRLALLTRRGLGMPVAGLVYWLAVALVIHWLPARTAILASFFATGAVFPLGALITRLAGGDLFAKSAILTPLGLQLAAVQLFYWPVIIVVWRNAPEWTPFTLAVLFGSHFLPYTWFYASRAYGMLAGLTAVVLTAAVMVAGDPLFQTAPLLAAGCYAVAIAMLAREVANDARAPAPLVP